MMASSKAKIMKMSVENLYQYLRDIFDDDTVTDEALRKFPEYKVKGEYIFELTNEDLLTIIPRLGERKAIQKLLASFKDKSVVSVLCIHSVR